MWPNVNNDSTIGSDSPIHWEGSSSPGVNVCYHLLQFQLNVVIDIKNEAKVLLSSITANFISSSRLSYGSHGFHSHIGVCILYNLAYHIKLNYIMLHCIESISLMNSPAFVLIFRTPKTFFR